MPILNATANPGVASWSADGDGLVLGSGGNARGTGAVDLQTTRAAATQVASGNYSAILWGVNNTASSLRSAAGGYGCVASGLYDNIALGVLSAAGYYGDVALGRMAGANGGYSFATSGSYIATASVYAVAMGTGNVQAGSVYAISLGASDIWANVDSGIAIGNSMQVRGDYSIGIGSNGNAGLVVGHQSAIAIGFGVQANAPYSIAIGHSNPKSVGNGAICISTFNAVSNYTQGNYALTLAGARLDADGNYSAVVGGYSGHATADFAFVAGGRSGLADHPGSVVFAANATGGDAQRGESQGELIHQDGSTTDGSTITLLSVAAEGIGVTASTCLSIEGTVTAWNETDSTSSAWFVRALVQRDGANNTTLVGQVGNGTAAAATGAITNDAGAATLAVAFAADDANETLDLNVTGVNPKAVRWSASLLVARAAT